ncbi:MAG: DNA topoisomerase, partial [Desulfobacterota bacterium]|nr:DNA topoisomerase [Thermodesulfobacteriota bacterium]
TESQRASLLSEEWLRWLSDGADKKNGRRPNGRTVAEKNEWLSKHSSFAAELVEVDGKKIESRNFEKVLDAARRAGFRPDEQRITENPSAKPPANRLVQLVGHLEPGPRWEVKSIQTKRTKSHPYAPFITSTLQQAAANQLDFSAQFTMSVAQNLYEGVTIQDMGSVGLITYMRTDSTHVSQEAIHMVRDYIAANHGGAYLPPAPNTFASSNKSAQEAHEAIRPTDVHLTPARVRSSLKESHYKLYKLIWERFVASQMTDAQWDATAVLVSGQDHKGELVFKATGRVLVFDGHYRVTGVPNASEEAVLPAVEEGKELGALQIDPIQSFTSPPPRYTEASLVRKLEAEGIGRPSTYAQIIQVIQNRKYVEKVRNRFYATDLGKVVTDKLMEAFPEIMQVGYTRDMEQQLDDIEDKHADWVEMLRRFYGPFTDNLQSAYNDLVHAKAETQPASYTCPQCGGQTVYRFGKKGRFLSCARYPKCKFAAPVDREGHPVAPEQTDIACPRCGSPMLLRRGRFGLFLSCERYPECSGIVNLDKKGLIAAPKIPPLPTGLSCPKCDAPMNLRRGARGPWLSCSKFPKCRGRIGWATLEEAERTSLEAALQNHEKENPLAAVRKTDGTAVSEGYKPQPLSAGGENADENGARAE